MKLKSTLEELNARFRVLNEQKGRLTRKSMTRSFVNETVLNKDPRIEELKKKLKLLINEN